MKLILGINRQYMEFTKKHELISYKNCMNDSPIAASHFRESLLHFMYGLNGFDCITPRAKTLTIGDGSVSKAPVR